MADVGETEVLDQTQNLTGTDENDDNDPLAATGGSFHESAHDDDPSAGPGRPSFRQSENLDDDESAGDLQRRQSSRRKSNLSHQGNNAASSHNIFGSDAPTAAGSMNNVYAAAEERYYHNEQQQHDGGVPAMNASARRALPTDPLAGAFLQFPVTFLKYSDKEAACVPVGAPDPFLPRRIADQRTSLADAPVVTGNTDVILDSLLPPRRTTVTYLDEDGGYQDTVDVVQRVSHQQIKRDELRQLRYELDVKLAESKARSKGICSVRRALHALMFDELIRQVTIDCPERGIVLRRVRDEIQMSLDAYHALYEESVNYSTNRCVAAAKHTPAMTLAIEQLTRERTELKKELRKLEAKESAMDRAVAEQQASDTKRHDEEKTFLERTKQRLEDQLNAVLAAQEAQKRAMREAASLG